MPLVTVPQRVKLDTLTHLFGIDLNTCELVSYQVVNTDRWWASVSPTVGTSDKILVDVPLMYDSEVEVFVSSDGDRTLYSDKHVALYETLKDLHGKIEVIEEMLNEQ